MLQFELSPEAGVFLHSAIGITFHSYSNKVHAVIVTSLVPGTSTDTKPSEAYQSRFSTDSPLTGQP